MRLLKRRSNRIFGFARSGAVMSGPEASFFHRVHGALGQGYAVFPHVALTSLVRPKTRNIKLRRQALAQVAQSRVDFVICRADTLTLVCVIELDDSSNDLATDRSRDALLASAGIVTLRFSASKLPSDVELVAHIKAIEDRIWKATHDSVASYNSGADNDWSVTGMRPVAK